MQYLSGVWDSLTGQSNAKRKRSDDDAGALPDRMTTLKLFTGQCPGRQTLPASSAYAQPPSEHTLFDADSSAASDTHLQADCDTLSGDWHTLAHSYSRDDQNLQFKVPAPPPQAQSQQQLHSNHAGSGFALYSSNSASLQPISTCYSQVPYTLTECSYSTHQPNLAQEHPHLHPQPQHTFHPGVHRSSKKQHNRSAHRQATAQTAALGSALALTHVAVQHAKPLKLHCSEVLSPVTHHTAPLQSMSTNNNLLDLPSPDLAESVADSPDDSEGLQDIATSPCSPIPGVLTAFLVLCQSPQITTALSKLQATHQLPCPTTLSVLPLDIQNCSVSMAEELATAGSLVQEWSKASQLEWTLAGMFALCLRAKLDVLDLDCIMLLSLLWILGMHLYNGCLCCACVTPLMCSALLQTASLSLPRAHLQSHLCCVVELSALHLWPPHWILPSARCAAVVAYCLVGMIRRYEHSVQTYAALALALALPAFALLALALLLPLPLPFLPLPFLPLPLLQPFPALCLSQLSVIMLDHTHLLWPVQAAIMLLTVMQCCVCITLSQADLSILQRAAPASTTPACLWSPPTTYPMPQLLQQLPALLPPQRFATGSMI